MMLKHLQVGIVAIGRNEGDRLKRALKSILSFSTLVVYVDSGSTDGSIEFACSLNVETVELDLSIPFTAARARNAGLKRLLELNPSLEYVQFIDGDCELFDDWLNQAMNLFASKSEAAVVCGRRRERFPNASIYNLLCELDWEFPIGEVQESTGDALMRIKAFNQVKGYNPSLIAGEDAELCIRLRQHGWKIFRLDADMTLHDADITHFSQWWRRSIRTGYAYAEGAWMYGHPPERHWVRERNSVWFWGLLLPVITLVGAYFSHGWGLLLVLGYPIMIVKIFYVSQRQHSWTFKELVLYSVFCTIGKFPQVIGQLQFLQRQLLGQQATLIEYK